MKSLIIFLGDKRIEVAQMTQAIALIESPPPDDLPLDRSKMDTLTRLERLLDAAADKDDRDRRLELAKQALIESQKELAQLESEVAQLEAFEQKAIRALDEAIAKFNDLGTEQAAIAIHIQEICQNSARDVSRLRGTAVFCPVPPKTTAIARYGSQIMFAPPS